MTDYRIAAYDKYLAAWSALPEDERFRLLHASLNERMNFLNPTKSESGVTEVAAHLARFQNDHPGASFRILSALGWENHALVEWQFVDAQGKSGFRGFDTVEYDAELRIRSIVMFTDIPKEQIEHLERAKR